MPAYKIEGIPIQVFNFFLPSLSLTEIFALFILDNSLAYTGPPEVLKMFWWFVFIFFSRSSGSACNFRTLGQAS